MKEKIFYLLFPILLFASCNQNNRTQLQLSVDASAVMGEIDLTRYSLGQGGLSSHPMIDSHIPQLQQLHPKTIRFFVQEYFNLYPAKGKYNWAILDKTLDAIIATGARPIPDICFKPALLFPQKDPKIVHPNDYAEWEELIYQLVKHCKEKKYDVEFWEIGNEVDLGELGGCPYLFITPQDYLIYYKHTADAILKADSTAKIGGPALANPYSPIGDSLIAFCAGGNAPLDYFTFHIYNSDPLFFQKIIRYFKNEKLAKYPQLKDTKTMITEWNMSLGNMNLDPYFQPAFIMETTRIFEEEGLSASSYYHIRDYYVDPAEFSSFLLSTEFVSVFTDMFNLMAYLGIYDNQGRVRPAYFALQCLSQQKGEKLEVKGTNEDIRSFSTKTEKWIYSVFWNYPLNGKAKKYECSIAYSGLKEGRYRVLRINPESALNNIEEVHSGNIKELDNNTFKITLDPYEIKWIELSLFPY